MDRNDLEKLMASNAKAIQALSESLAEEKKQRQKIDLKWDKERSQLYQYLGRIASAQSNFYEVQADYYEQLAIVSQKQTQIEEKQTQIEEQFKERQTQIEERHIQLEEQQIQMQSQIVELLKKLSNSSN